MAIILSREQLSTMLKEELEQYNISNPEGKMDAERLAQRAEDRKSTRLNSSH